MLCDINLKPSLYQDKIGIVLATYNPNLGYFEKQIVSICKQSFSNWVCHIVDDCSSEESQEQIKKIASVDNRFICHFHEKNLGCYYNFERGLKYCVQDKTITLVAFSDQDDIWLEDKLCLLLKNMNAENAILAHSDLELIDKNDETICTSCWSFEDRNPEGITTNLLLLRNVVTGCTVIFRSEILPKIIPFPALNNNDWNHDLWVAFVASCSGKIAHLRQPLVKYRQHGSNVVGAVQNPLSLRTQLSLWVKQQNFKVTGKTYCFYKKIAQAFHNTEKENLNYNNLFDERKDFGFGFLKLGVYSLLTRYGVEGIAFKLFVYRLIINIKQMFSMLPINKNL
jgi:glycosyltransferase involved in cell wall biosynthesis